MACCLYCERARWMGFARWCDQFVCCACLPNGRLSARDFGNLISKCAGTSTLRRDGMGIRSVLRSRPPLALSIVCVCVCLVCGVCESCSQSSKLVLSVASSPRSSGEPSLSTQQLECTSRGGWMLPKTTSPILLRVLYRQLGLAPTMLEEEMHAYCLPRGRSLPTSPLRRCRISS